jgi:hypothetical protein
MNSYSEPHEPVAYPNTYFRKIHLQFASVLVSFFQFSNQNIKKSDVQYHCLYYTGPELGPAADSCSDEYKKLHGYRSTRNSLNFREIKHHPQHHLAYEFSSVLVLRSSVATASELLHVKFAVPRVDVMHAVRRRHHGTVGFY